LKGSPIPIGNWGPVRRVGQCFGKVGHAKRDRAAILSENCHRYIETIAGMAKGGFILCTLNYLLHKDELAYILRIQDHLFYSSIENTYLW